MWWFGLYGSLAGEDLQLKERREDMMEPANGMDETRHICLSQAELAELRTDSLGEKLQVMIENLPTGEVSMLEINKRFR